MQTIHTPFPAARARRLRRDDFSRRLVAESRLDASDFIYPVFVMAGSGAAQQSVPSMPGVVRHSIEALLPVAEHCQQLGIPVLALFPAIEPELKDEKGSEAANEDGLIPRAVRALKKRFPDLGVMTDVALDPYTSHGQDGLLDESGYILNDETVKQLATQQPAPTSSPPAT